MPKIQPMKLDPKPDFGGSLEVSVQST